MLSKIYCVYSEDKQIEEYNLKETNVLKLFNANNLNLKENNINHINKYFCELCAYYYVWKNQIKSDYIGFCHYSKFFNIDKFNIDFFKEDKSVQCYEYWITWDNYIIQLNNWLTLYDIKWNLKIISHFINYMFEYYNINLYEIVSQKYFNEDNEYYQTGKNMYIFKWDDFNYFCEILFGFLNYLEENERKRITEIQINLNSDSGIKVWGCFMEVITSVIICTLFKPFINN